MNMQRTKISGLVGTVEINSQTPVGTMIFDLLLNPLMWEGTRVQLESLMWQQFRFTNLQFRVKPGVPSICSGAYVHGHDTEPENQEFSGAELVQYLSYLPGAAYSNIWQPSSAVCQVSAAMRSQSWFKLENATPDKPDYCQGRYYLALAEKFSGLATGDVSISIWAEGEIEFCGRRIPRKPDGGTDPVIYFLPTGTNYNVDSNAQLIVPGYDWSRMINNAVYQVMPFPLSNVGGTQPVSFLRRVTGNNAPICFESVADATADTNRVTGSGANTITSVDHWLNLVYVPPSAPFRVASAGSIVRQPTGARNSTATASSSRRPDEPSGGGQLQQPPKSADDVNSTADSGNSSGDRSTESSDLPKTALAAATKAMELLKLADGQFRVENATAMATDVDLINAGVKFTQAIDKLKVLEGVLTPLFPLKTKDA